MRVLGKAPAGQVLQGIRGDADGEFAQGRIAGRDGMNDAVFVFQRAVNATEGCVKGVAARVALLQHGRRAIKDFGAGQWREDSPVLLRKHVEAHVQITRAPELIQCRV